MCRVVGCHSMVGWLGCVSRVVAGCTGGWLGTLFTTIGLGGLDAHCSARPSCSGGWLGSASAHCSARSLCSGGWLGTSQGSARADGGPVGLYVNIWSKTRDKIGLGMYLATGHVIVWHCFMCRVLQVLVSWLHSGSVWLSCSAWSSSGGVVAWL